MCGRFEVKAATKQLKERFDLKLAPPLHAGEQHPTARILTIDTEQGLARGRLLGWGLNVSWSKAPIINARAETLAKKPTFRPLLNRRCLVPATAYFEWQRLDDGNTRKMRIRPGDQDVFAMAGLVDETGDFVTIVTCPPASEIAAIHDRMPVILPRDGEPAWMDSKRPFDDVEDALAPYAGGLTASPADE